VGQGIVRKATSAWDRAVEMGRSTYDWGRSKLKEAGNVARSWTKSMENTVKKFCTTAKKIKNSAVDFVKNVDWGKVASGALKLAAGAVLTVGAVAIIAATGGTALAAGAALLAGGGLTAIGALAIGTTAAAGAAVLFGTSDAVEGAGEVSLGLAGRSNTAASNPMRDTVFRGNAEAYALAEFVTTTGMYAGYSALSSSGALNSNEETSSERIKRNASYDNSGEGAGGADDVPQIKKNAAQGKAYEQQEFSKFANKADEAVEQVTIKTTDGTKVRVDAIGIDKNSGNVVINEFKSSPTAPLTKNQKIGFPQLESDGGTVVGKGKGIFTGGYEIPAGTKVEIIRPFK